MAGNQPGTGSAVVKAASLIEVVDGRAPIPTDAHRLGVLIGEAEVVGTLWVQYLWQLVLLHHKSDPAAAQRLWHAAQEAR